MVGSKSLGFMGLNSNSMSGSLYGVAYKNFLRVLSSPLCPCGKKLFSSKELIDLDQMKVFTCNRQKLHRDLE